MPLFGLPLLLLLLLPPLLLLATGLVPSRPCSTPLARGLLLALLPETSGGEEEMSGDALRFPSGEDGAEPVLKKTFRINIWPDLDRVALKYRH